MRVVLLAYLLCTTWSLLGQEVRWYTMVDKEAPANSVIKVEFVLENRPGGNFVPPDFSGWKVLTGPALRSQTSVINGRVRSSQSYAYQLMALSPGNYTLGSASIVVDRVQYNTNPISIRITEGEDLREMLISQGQDFFLKAKLSRDVVYPGQQVIIDYVLYYNTRLKVGEILQEDTYKDLFARRIPGEDNSQRIEIGNKVYYSSSVASRALFPQVTGDYEIKPFKLSVGIPKDNEGRRYSFFQEYTPAVVESEGLRLKVIDFPENKADGFSGAVGEFDLHSNLAEQTIKQDDAAVLRVAVRGDGDLRLITPPVVIADSLWEVYEPTVVDENENLQNSTILTYKEFEYLFLPKATGVMQLPALKFVYFDPETQSFKTIETERYTINVEPGRKADLMGGAHIGNKREMADFRNYQKVVTSSNPFFGAPFLAGCGILLLLTTVFFLKGKSIDRFDGLDESEKRKLQSRSTAVRRLQKAKALMTSGHDKAFFEELSLTLKTYISDKFALESKVLPTQRAMAIMRSHGIDEKLAREYESVLAACEMHIFAGQRQDMSLAYDRAQSFIEGMEGENL